MALDERKGVWKSGKGKGRHKPKGRQVQDDALGEIQALLSARPRRADLLIEYMHLIQYQYGHLSSVHFAALAEEMKLAQSEVYEVATFYAHFDVVKEGEAAPPNLTIRVCDSLACELAGSEDLLRDLVAKYSSGTEVRVLRAPCMGRCDTAPALELGHNHLDNATVSKVETAIATDDTKPQIPDYEQFKEYFDGGGYQTLKSLRGGAKTPDQLQDEVLESGLRSMGGAGFQSGKKW